MTQLRLSNLATKLAWRIMPAFDWQPDAVTLTSIKDYIAAYECESWEIDSPTCRHLTQWEIGRIAGIILRII